MNALIQEAAENCELTTQSYSGRGMYGSECVGIVCDNPIQTIVRLSAELAVMTADDPSTMILELSQAKTDSMGMDSILYFPNIPFE